MSRTPLSYLKDTHPQLAAQLVDVKLADTLATHSHDRVLWRCDAGHEWRASVASRTRGAGCPYCSGRLAIPGETDLATTHPDFAATLVDSAEARTVSAGSARRLKWRCVNDKRHVWSCPVKDRLRAGLEGGCPICAGRKPKTDKQYA